MLKDVYLAWFSCIIDNEPIEVLLGVFDFPEDAYTEGDRMRRLVAMHSNSHFQSVRFHITPAKFFEDYPLESGV